MSGGFVEGDAVRQARAAGAVANARAAALRLQKLEGRVIDRQEVEKALEDMANTLRDRLLALPAALAPDLAAIGEPATIEEALTSALWDVLTTTALEVADGE